MTERSTPPPRVPDHRAGHTRERNVVERLAGALTGRVVDGVVDHVDLDAALEAVDVNAVLDRVDVNALLDRIDVNRLMERVDIDQLLARADVEALVARSGIPDIVTASTTRVATSTLDLARRQIAGVDFVIGGGVDRLLRRPSLASAGGPASLVGEVQRSTGPRRQITGHYGGPVGRALAFAADSVVISTTFSLSLAAIDLIDRTLLGDRIGLHAVGWWGAAAVVVLAALYSFVCLTIAGRTVGKALVGLRVVTRQGEPLRPGGALRRTLAFPITALLGGLGFLAIVFGREHRALHDKLAGTAVVLDFGDRPAELPGPLTTFLNRSAA